MDLTVITCHSDFPRRLLILQLSPRNSGTSHRVRESEAFVSNGITSTNTRVKIWPVEHFLRLWLQSWWFIRSNSVVKIMVGHCNAYGCVNRSNKAECSKLSWHSLPMNNAKHLRTWLLRIKRKDPPVSKHSYLCSQHFSENCFKRCAWRKRYLKRGSVRTRFTFSPEEHKAARCLQEANGPFPAGHVLQQA